MEMEIVYIVAGSIAALGFLFSIMRKRSSGLRGTLYKLENETTALEVKLQAMQEEYNSLKQNVAQMHGTIKQHEETEASKQQLQKAAQENQKKRAAESFTDFLLRKNYISQSSIQKVQEYKRKNGSDVSIAELLVMFDHISASNVIKAKEEYQSGK